LIPAKPGTHPGKQVEVKSTPWWPAQWALFHGLTVSRSQPSQTARGTMAAQARITTVASMQRSASSL
jgi:hypothetical protein